MSPLRRLERPGLSATQERVFNIVSTLVVVVFTIGWTYALADARTREATPPILAAAETLNPLSSNAPPPAPYLLDAAVRALTREPRLRGLSGALRVDVQ